MKFIGGLARLCGPSMERVEIGAFRGINTLLTGPIIESMVKRKKKRPLQGRTVAELIDIIMYIGN